MRKAFCIVGRGHGQMDYLNMGHQGIITINHIQKVLLKSVLRYEFCDWMTSLVPGLTACFCIKCWSQLTNNQRMAIPPAFLSVSNKE